MNQYQKLKQQIAPILISSGFKEMRERIHPESFGSACSEFEKDKIEIRIIWKGRDSVCRVDFHNKHLNSEWEAISTYADSKVYGMKDIEEQVSLVKSEVLKLMRFISG